MDSDARQLLSDSLRSTMTAASGAKLDAALSDLGWLDMLAEMPEFAVSLIFRLLGETGVGAGLLDGLFATVFTAEDRRALLAEAYRHMARRKAYRSRHEDDE